MAKRNNATSRFHFNNQPVRPREGFKSSALPEYRIHVVEIINIPTVIHLTAFGQIGKSYCHILPFCCFHSCLFSESKMEVPYCQVNTVSIESDPTV